MYMDKNLLLVLKDVEKMFNTSPKETVHAVKCANLTLEANQWIAIVGGSGSGKSTLANMVAKIYEPSKGEILLNGENIQTIASHTFYRQVQMIFQNPQNSFSPRMKIIDFLCEPFMNFYRLSKKQAREEAEKIIASVFLPETVLDKYPHELSGGQLQRVVIARAISVNPALLICDESTSALDMMIQQEIINLLQQLRSQRPFSNIFITHDIHLAVLLCEKIYVMEKGEIVEVLTPDTVHEAKHPYSAKLLTACTAMTV